MQAVILAAGTGSRLAAVTGGVPKCLVEIGGRPLIEHQLESLADAGIGDILIVTGYRGEDVRSVVGVRARSIENPEFADTNSLYSLSLAKEWVTGPFVLLNSDILFHPEILHRLLSKGGNAIAFDSSSSGGQEQTKISLREGRVIDIGKDLAPELSRGESLGVLCFDKEGSRLLFDRADALVRAGGKRSWVMEAVRSTCTATEVKGVNVAGLPWAEIDFPYDLDRAVKEVWPKIRKTRWKRTVHWKVLRWVALFLTAMLLGAGGWGISSYFAHQAIVWTTMQPETGTPVELELGSGRQHWWSTTPDNPLGISLHGPSAVRIELRLLVGAGDPLPGRYVVEVSVNGRPHTWEVFRVTPDPDARLGDSIVGDRDRIELILEGGKHIVGIRLLAGTSSALLARVRQPEPELPEEGEND